MEKDANMKRTVIVAATAAALVAGSALAYNAYARYDGWSHGRHFSRMSPDDMGAYADARIAALKAGLRLTSEQEAHWPAVETALKELAAKRVERREERRAQRAERRADRTERAERPNPVERLRSHADRLSETGADLKRLADATDPLYQSLDENQKRRFQTLAHAGMRSAQRHRDRNDRAWRRGEFDGPRHRGDGPATRERIEWSAPATDGAERL